MKITNLLEIKSGSMEYLIREWNILLDELGWERKAGSKFAFEYWYFTEI